jgi:hypothetical protein
MMSDNYDEEGNNFILSSFFVRVSEDDFVLFLIESLEAVLPLYWCAEYTSSLWSNTLFDI